MLQVCQLTKCRSLFIVACLILVVVAASLAVLYENGFLTDSTELESTGILWQRGIENFATGLNVADEKVFTIDIGGGISCYEAQTGELVWNSGIVGCYWCSGVVASSSMVSGGTDGAYIGALDRATREFQWKVKAPETTGLWNNRAPSSISVVENRLFATADGFGAFNATTGQPLWEYETSYFQLDANVTHPNWLKGWAFEGNRVFAAGGVTVPEREINYVYRLDPDNGTILWSVPRSTRVNGLPVVYEGQVIMWNSSEGETTVFSLNETSGAILWSYNVGASIYQPTAYNGLLVFEASDGNVYALHLSEGTLAWKTHVDSQNITALDNSDNPLKGLTIQIDPQNQRAIGGFAVTTQLAAFVQNGSDEYNGFLCSLDINNGRIVWTKQFSANGNVSHENASFDFALTENNIYLTTEFDDFWILSKSTGNIIESQHFEHYISSPVAADNRVFVAADLWLIVYE